MQMTGPEHVSSWESNEEAFNNLKRMLVSSGVPFEALIANDCRRFSATYTDATRRVDSVRLLYGNPDQGTALREVDQCVSIYSDIDIAGVFGVQLNFQIVIECKARTGLQVFGFPIDPLVPSQTPLIVASGLAHSGFLNEISLTLVEEFGQPNHAIAVLVDPLLKGQLRTSDEQLVYKGASAVIDFVNHDSSGISDASDDSAIEAIGLADAFDKYIARTHEHPLYVARRWLQEHISEFRQLFAEYLESRQPVYHLVNVYCPVLCLSASAYEVTLGSNGDIDQVIPNEILLTGVRPSGWPHSLRKEAPGIGPESIIAVVTRSGLNRLLPALYEWFLDTDGRFRNLTELTARDLLLEAIFLRSVRQAQTASEPYRSDLHFFDFQF